MMLKNSHTARKLFIATGIVATLMFTSACSPASEESKEPRETSTASTTVSASPTASAESTKGTPSSTGVKAGNVINGIPTKAELANDGKGEYIQTTINDDDPAMTYDASLVEETASSRFSVEEITLAQQTAVKFIAEEGIDSILNGSPANYEAWWEANKNKVDPEGHSDLYATVAGNDPTKPFVMRGHHRDGKYELVYGTDRTHVASRTIKVTRVIGGDYNGGPVIGVATDTQYSLNAIVDGKEIEEGTSATFSLTLRKDEATGQFLIIGFNNNASTIPVG